VIVDRDEKFILDHAGWGPQHHDMWCYDIRNGREIRLDIFPRGFQMKAMSDGVSVRLVEPTAASGFRCTIRPIADVQRVQAEAVYEHGRWAFVGDPSAWVHGPRYVVVAQPDYSNWLLHIDEADTALDPLDWYNSTEYDLGYQGLLDVYEIPSSELLAFAVQRDSRPVVYDPRRRAVVTHIELAGQAGNPSLIFRRRADELWVDDYDTLVRLRPGTWERLDIQRLQEPKGGVAHFIGAPSMPWDERCCVVPRPYKRDVLFIDTRDFRLIDILPMGGHPLGAVLLNDGTVVGRDYESRRLLVARWTGNSKLA
jgi:hypothetical protein